MEAFIIIKLTLMMILIRPLTTKLTDFSGSDYIPIEDGDVIIWQEFNYLRHTTNLTIYSEIAEETEKLTNHLPSSHMVKILEADIKRIRSLLESLYVHHRHARSIKMENYLIPCQCLLILSSILLPKVLCHIL